MGNMNQDFNKKNVGIFLIAFIMLFSIIPEVEGGWWNLNWNKCRTININTDVQTDFNAVRINVTGMTIQSDGDDIRIINRACDNGGAEIDYGLLRVHDATSAEIAFVANTTDSLNYSIYYSNPSAGKPNYNGISAYSLEDNQTMFSNFWYNITLQNYTGVLTNLTYKQGDPIFEAKPPDAGIFSLINVSGDNVFRGGNQQTKGAICQLADNSSEYVRWTCTRHNYTQSYEFWDAPMIESDILLWQSNFTRIPFDSISPTTEPCSTNFRITYNDSATTSTDSASTSNCAVNSPTKYTGNLSNGLLLYYNLSANSKNVFVATWVCKFCKNVDYIGTNNASFVFASNSVGGLINNLLPSNGRYANESFKIRLMFFNKTTDYSTLSDSTWKYYLNYSFQLTREKNITILAEENSNINLFKCIGVTNDTQVFVLNFTIRVENNETNISGSFKATFKTTLFNTTNTLINTTYEFENIKEIYLCLDSPDANVTTDATIQYSAPNHDVREYYLYQKLLSKATANITLYVLEIVLGSPITFTVEDSNGIAQNGLFIRAERYDVGTNQYKTVAMGRTDSDGKDLLFLRKQDALYRLSVEEGNTIKYIYLTTRKITADAITLIISPTTIKDILDRIGRIRFYLYNTSTQIILNYTNPEGDNIENCLSVLKYNSSFYDFVFNKCSNLTADEIIYTIDSRNATYVAGYYTRLNPQVYQKTLVVRIYDAIQKSKVFGLTGLFGGMLLILFLGTVGVAIGSIPAVVILTLIGYFISGMLGLISGALMTWTIGIGLVIIGIIAILLSKT